VNPRLHSLLNQQGGVARRRELLAAGATGAQLGALVHSGELVRPRIGWYCHSAADARVIEAVRVGGVVSCVSAAALDGLWAADEEELHLCVRGNGSRFRSRNDQTEYPEHVAPTDVAFHWDSAAWSRSHGHRLAPLDYLQHVVLCQPPALAICVLDSALNTRRVSLADLARLRQLLPAVHRPTIDLVDGRAESGIESLTRLGLSAASIRFEPQVEIAKTFFVDFLIEGILVIETDGSRYFPG
jgi:hypothetical protein